MTQDTIKKNRRKLDKLLLLLQGNKTLLIVMQDYPDPDAIAAAAALRHLANTSLGIACTLGYSGGIGRAENRALVKYTGLNLRLLSDLEPEKFDLIALVDTQPGTGNNALPGELMPDIVIDHHPICKTTRSAMFTDVRSRYGATSTILYEYLKELNITIEVNLATTILYGIRSDTQDLGRKTTQADINAYLALYPNANKRMLSRIMNATVPRNYFQVITTGLARAMLYGPGIITFLGELHHPDVLGEVADLLMRNEESEIALTFGVHQNRILLSLRTSNPDLDAGKVIRSIVGKHGTGGGHNLYAGGQLPLKDPEDEEEKKHHENEIFERFRKTLKRPEDPGELLVNLG